MERLKKIMVISAIAGTVLFTGLFCYMPIRHLVKENNKQEISLSQENAADENGQAQENVTAETGKVQALGNDGAESGGDGHFGGENPADVQQEDHQKIRAALLVKSGGRELEVSLWQSNEGTYYFFLPGFAEEAQISLAGVGEKSLSGDYKGSILFANKEIQAGDILTDIVWGVPYEMTVYEKEDAEGIPVSVVFMCGSQLPVLSVTTRSGDMQYIDDVKGNEELGEILLLDEQGKFLYQGDAESIRGRGNSTWGLLKKPYQFKLAEKADLLGFGATKSWVLLANGYDETNLRNQIALELAVELGMDFVPEGRMVDVYMNNEYYGCYFLSEKIGIGENQIDIQDLEEKTNLVYREEDLNNVSVIENETGTRRYAEIEVEETDLSGGYLFERELKDRYAEEISGFVTDQGDHYALKNPAYATEAQVDFIAGLMQEFQDAVEQEDGIHPVTGKHYSEYIDVTSFVQKYLVEEISKNYDGGVTSSFFYKPQDDVSRKIFAGPVWDYDIAFGNCNLDKIVSNPIGITKLNDHTYGTEVFADLYEQEDFYEKAAALYKEKALPYLNRLLEGGIDELVEETYRSSAMNHLRWEDLSNRYQYYDEYDNDVRYLKYFIENRRDFLNEVWIENVVYHRVVYLVDGEPYKADYIKDGETVEREPIPHKENALFAGWFTPKGNVPFDEYKPVYEDMVFTALWQDLTVGKAAAGS